MPSGGKWLSADFAASVSEPGAKRQRPKRKTGQTSVNGKWLKIMLMSGVTAAILAYDMATATEAPRLQLAFLQYSLLAMSALALLGAAVMYAKGQ